MQSPSRLSPREHEDVARNIDRSEKCESADTDTVAADTAKAPSSRIGDRFSRSIGARGGGAAASAVPRTVCLQAETERERDAWVQFIKMAVLRRRVVKEAIQVAAERLDANSLEWGPVLCLWKLVQSIIDEDKGGAFRELAGKRVDFDCADADLDILWGPLKRNTCVTELDLSCPSTCRGSLTDNVANALGLVLKANTRLTSLVLSNQSIGDRGAVGLVECAATQMSLTQLNLDRCAAITEEGVQQVYSKLADLENTRFHLRLPDKALAYRALAGKVPTPLTETEAQLLHRVVWPVQVALENEEVCQRLIETWHIQGLEFADPAKVCGGGGRFQFGLMQHRNGPCGILAAVQAELLRELVWPEIEEDENVDCMDWDTLEKDVLREVSTKSLVKAVSEIIWRARPEKEDVAKMVLVDEELSHPLAYDSLEVVTCGSKEQVLTLVRGVLDVFTRPGGVILLLYSVVLTRGCHKVWLEAGNATPLTPTLLADDETPGIVQTLVVMEGDWPFCEQTLVNLFLIGQAQVDLDPKCKCPIGFLTYMENLRPADVTGDWTDPTVVGTNYKTPTCPIWVVHGGNHYTVLIARSKGLLKLPESTKAEKKDDSESRKIRRHRRVPSGGMEGSDLLPLPRPPCAACGARACPAAAHPQQM